MSTSSSLSAIDEMAEALVPGRLTRLQSGLGLGGNLYLLVDPMMGDPVLGTAPPDSASLDALDELRSAAWERSVYSLGLPEGAPLDSSKGPYLVGLIGANDHWLQSSVEWALIETLKSRSGGLLGQGSTSFRMGAWLETDRATSGQQLAQQLTRWLKLRTQVRTGAHYLRLADRRVWGLCVHVLGEEPLAAQLGCVRRWHWLDHHMQWQSLSGAPSTLPTTPNAAPLSATIPSFTKEQWAIMSIGNELHMAMACAHGQRRLDQTVRPQMVSEEGPTDPVRASDWNQALQALEAVRVMRGHSSWQERLVTPVDMAIASALTLLRPQWLEHVQQNSTQFQGPVSDWALDIYKSVPA